MIIMKIKSTVVLQFVIIIKLTLNMASSISQLSQLFSKNLKIKFKD